MDVSVKKETSLSIKIFAYSGFIGGKKHRVYGAEYVLSGYFSVTKFLQESQKV